MKPAIKRTVNKSVDRTQRNKEKEKEFEVFLGGANKERVQEKIKGDKRIPPREMKKWENPKQKKPLVSETLEEDLPMEDIEDDTDIIQELQSLGQQELELLKKSIYQQPILSVSQLNVLKKLSEGNPIDEKFNPHFSRLSDDLTQVDVLTKHIPEEEVDLTQKIIVKTDNSYEEDYCVEEKINEDQIQEVIVQKKQPTVPPPQHLPSKPQRKTVQAQKVVQPVKSSEIQISNQKNRPISAMQLAKDPQPTPFMSTPVQQQVSSQKRINTNPFQNSRPKSVVQNPQITPGVSIVPRTLEQLISRIQNMDENAQIRLIKLLDSIENGENLVEQRNEPQKKQQLSLELPKDSFVQSQSQQFKIGQNDQQFNKCIQIVIQLLNTWGSSSMIGLTEIQVFDMQGQLIKLQTGALLVRGAQSIKPIDILANGNAQTTNAGSMWLASIVENSKIEIEVRVFVEPRQIKIWNYNKSMIDSQKGVKDVVICVLRPDGVVREIKAQVNRGTGHDMEDFGTLIELLEPEQDKFYEEHKQEFEQVKQEQQERLPSRKQRGPVVYNIFNEDEQSRQGTGKRESVQSPKNQNNQIFQNQIQPQVGRIRGQNQQVIQQVDDEDLMKTLKNFALNNPGRFHENKIEQEEINKKVIKTTELDALDMFFKEQRETKVQPKIQVQQQQNQDIYLQRTRQTEKNAQLINQIIQENNALIKDQTQKSLICIPNFPIARYVTIKIYSTWGDRHYVGLNGIEFWDDKGQPIEMPMAKKQIKADPSDINVLNEQSIGDPRTPDKLIDGVYLTQSDMHVWLAPFTQGKINQIYIDFLEKKKISMIRIWNYNKSRTHSFRGVKEISITLDKSLVFRGIICKAPGNLSFQEAQNEQLYEIINFTDNYNILNIISTQDWINQASFDQKNTSMIERPPTSSNSQIFIQNELQRPTTSAKVSNLLKEVKQARQIENQIQSIKNKKHYKNLLIENNLYCAFKLSIRLEFQKANVRF